MIITADPNYLAHYGVLGMKWGIRKRSSNGGKVSKKASKLVSKRVEKQQERNKKLKEDTDRYGVVGVAVGRHVGYSAGHGMRSIFAHVINNSANAYIATNSSKRVAKGVDYARRASISYLSLKDSTEKINALADVGKAAIYSSKKKRDT